MSSSKKQMSESARRARNLRRRAIRLETLEGRLLMTGPETLNAPLSLGGANFGPGTTHDHDHAPAPVNEPLLPPSYGIIQLNQYLTGPSQKNQLDIALDYMRSQSTQLGLTPADLEQVVVTDLYTDTFTGTTHIYMRQELNGIEVNNAIASANVDAQGRLINVYSRFVQNVGAGIAEGVPQAAMSATDALLAAAPVLGLSSTAAPRVVSEPTGLNQKTTIKLPGISVDDIPSKLQYIVTESGTVLSWSYMVKTPDGDHWYDLNVNANDGTPVALVDWVAHAAYNVFPLPGESPLDVPRRVLTDPHDPTASPYGWHDTNGAAGAEFTDTRGNNVFAQADTQGNNQGTARPDGGAGLTFNFPFNPRQAPSTYLNAAITNLFYMNNMLHDVHYKYGFNEVAGNFQMNNYGNGGVGNDPVQADGQDAGGLNNANMATPPDGFSPRMQMFLWDTASPMLDGDFDNMVIVHEYGHGVSNRLTGGPANSSALFAVQSGGMGEGWSDWWSLMFTAKPTDLMDGSYPVGNYVLGYSNSGPGIRRYPYSFDMAVNPQTIGDFNGGFPNSQVHNAGELWCGALWDMNQLLVEKYGFNPNISAGYTGPGSAGNITAMRIVMDALKLQPANPSFQEARDAVIQADFVLTGGANRKEIWTAFGRRGMGVSFSTPNSNSTRVTPAFDTPNFVNGVSTLTGQVGSQSDFSNVVVATYTEAATDPAGTYTAVINWGDNTSSPGVVQKIGRTVIVRGSHVYNNYGNLKMSVVVTNAGVWSEQVTNPVNVLDAPITAGTSINLSASEGVQVAQNVVNFVSGNASATPSQFRASIRWGDTYTTPGLVQVNPNGGFSVYGSHTYRQGGNFNISVLITSLGGTRGTVTSPITVADSALTTSAVNAVAAEAINFSGVVATYLDASPDGGLPTDWLAVIDWGDNTKTTKGVITPGPNFTVTGSHTYARFGTYPVKVKLTNTTGSATYDIESTMTVTEAPVDGAAGPISASVGSPYSAVLATYTPSNPAKLLSDFTATINWGDGTTEPGILAALPNGKFTVSGSHTYRTPGTLSVIVQLVSVGQTPIDPIVIPAVVTDAPLTLSFSGVAVGPANNPSASTPGLTVPLGQPFNGQLLTFTTSDPNAAPSDFTALIIWGDGTQTTGQLVRSAPSTSTTSFFALPGSHTYATAGTFPLSVRITSPGGLLTNASGAARVILPLNGQLDPSSDTGASNSDRVTSAGQLVFRGNAEYNGVVRLYARPADGTGSPILIGTGTANGLGVWSATTSNLGDGRYIVSAEVTNNIGGTIQTATDLGSPVTIDKVGPSVLSVRLDAMKGKATIVFSDNGSGLYNTGLLNPASYSLTLPTRRGTSTIPTVSVVQPVTTAVATGEQTVVVSFKTRGRLGNGGYVLRINSNVVSDQAGNALFERTFVAFPQLTNVPINTFIAQIDVNNGVASAPRAYVPLPEIIAAQNYTNTVRQGGTVRIRRRGR